MPPEGPSQPQSGDASPSESLINYYTIKVADKTKGKEVFFNWTCVSFIYKVKMFRLLIVAICLSIQKVFLLFVLDIW